MRFAPAPEQVDFAASLRRFLDTANVPAVARAWAAGDTNPGEKLWSLLAAQGVTSLGRAEDGATSVDLVLGFLELGRAAVPGPYVESVAVLPALGIDRGDTMCSLAAPPHVPFALDGAVADAVYRLDGEQLATARVVREHESVDRSRRPAAVEAIDPARSVAAADAFDAGALATAAQIHGAGQAVLDRATDYAKQRHQFGKPIGSFQAVKHQLADALVGLELARPLLFGAALAMSTSTQARDVSAAKVACTDAAYRAGRVALQVHGAIGYTAEYDLALWLTKIRALTFAWGTQQLHRNRVLDAIR
jgi:hypothetical protein